MAEPGGHSRGAPNHAVAVALPSQKGFRLLRAVNFLPNTPTGPNTQSVGAFLFWLASSTL